MNIYFRFHVDYYVKEYKKYIIAQSSDSQNSKVCGFLVNESDLGLEVLLNK